MAEINARYNSGRGTKNSNTTVEFVWQPVFLQRDLWPTLWALILFGLYYLDANWLFAILIALVFILQAVMIFINWLRSMSSRIAIDNNHLVIENGLIAKATNIFEFDKLLNVEIFQSWYQRLWGCGCLRLSQGPHIKAEIDWLPNPGAIKAEIMKKKNNRV